MKNFQLGQQVAWTSQSAGVAKIKAGEIDEVVPAGKYPDRSRFEALYRGPGVGLHRGHESYVVLVPGKTPRSKGKLYWPRVTHLREA